jgi:hypothetical protein
MLETWLGEASFRGKTPFTFEMQWPSYNILGLPRSGREEVNVAHKSITLKSGEFCTA